MNWSRFKFYCNEVSRLLEKGEEVIPAFKSAKASVLSREFGPELNPQEIQASIFASLKNEGYTNEEVKEALKIYDGLDVSELVHKPSRIRRVGIYIGYLTFMYFVLSSIYFVYVIPQTVSMFEAMEIPAPESFIWFVNNWATILIIVMTLLVGALLVSKKIKEIFEYRNGVERSIIYRFMLPEKIKSRYEKLTSLIHLPLYIAKKESDGINDHIVQHYDSEKYSSKEISDSLSILINENVNNLLSHSESYMRRIYVVVAILVIFSIYEFVSSAYAPLFVMGEVV
ncbi:hypothetical protein JYT10_00620 [Beggiatoa alba]|nr:hypothetical protein [Beggiatoa alba]